MVASNSPSIPIQIPQPRYLVIDPTISRAQAQVRADSRAERAFGIKSLLGRSETAARAVQLCLAPFWSLRLRAQLSYHRPVTYRLAPQDADARETELEGTDGRRLTLAITPQVKELTVRAVERCLAERDSAVLVEAYAAAGGESLTQRAMARLGREQDRLRPLLANPSRQIADFGAFFLHKRLDGRPLYDEWRDEDLLVAQPAENVNRLLAGLMQEIVAGLGEVTVRDWRVAVEAADLYYRPVYLFEFTRADKSGTVVETKLEQMNALTGEWSAFAPAEEQPAAPWDTVYAQVTPAAAALLDSLGGPWLRPGAEGRPADAEPVTEPSEAPMEPSAPATEATGAAPAESAPAGAVDVATVPPPPPPPPAAAMPRLAPVASSADNDEVTPEVEAADKAGAPDEAEPEEETGGAE